MSAIERLRAMVDSGRLRASAVELLDELRIDDVRALIEALEAIVESIDKAYGAIERWEMTEEREERGEAREEALEAIEEVCDAAEYDAGEVDVPGWLKLEIVRPTSDELEEQDS